MILSFTLSGFKGRLFNLFNDKGYVTTSMHDFTEWYY